MNPLTLVKRTQQINSKEAALGISEDASWHTQFKDSAYVFVGGIPFELTEGDLLAVFSQYGEVVDVNLVRDKATGKSKGFAFLAYEDQRSTILAVDNLNGAKLLGRIVRVDHVAKYKKKAEEDEEEFEKKRQERGICRAFQRGECNRGASCKFSHDEERNANTGWGEQDVNSRWTHDMADKRVLDDKPEERGRIGRSSDRSSRTEPDEPRRKHSSNEPTRIERDRKDSYRHPPKYDNKRPKEDREGYPRGRGSIGHRAESEDDQDKRRSEKRSRHDRESRGSGGM